MTRDSTAIWTEEVASEVAFWSKIIGSEKSKFQRRYSRKRPLNQFLPPLVGLVDSPEVSIVDVGCGPAPTVIGTYPKPVRIVGCDPLADEYRRLFEPHGVKPTVELKAVPGEKLGDVIEPASFDVSHIRNALDHSYNPAAVLDAMFESTKPGGLVLVRTVINEGKDHAYSGLHQWDLYPGAADFYIRNQDGEEISVRAHLGDRVELILVGLHPVVHQSDTQDWMDVVMVKRGAKPGFCSTVSDVFFATQIEVLRHAVESTRVVTTQKTAVVSKTQDLTELNDLRAGQREAEQDMARMKRSISYQLGTALVNAKKSPGDLLALPGQLARIAAESRRRRRKRP